MALATATITYNLADMVGSDFDTRRTKVWVTTNVPGETVIDTAGNEIRVGCGQGTVGSDGTGSVTVWTPGTGSNPASWQTYVHVDYPDSAPGRNSRGHVVRTFGPFTIAASADLADLVAEQEVPPEYLTTVTTALDAKVDSATAASTSAAASATSAAASASLAQDISNISTPDGVIATNINTSGSATDTALKAAYGRGQVDPRVFGALYNGTHDDAPAIQQALDTGLDVVIGRASGGALLDVKVGATLTMTYAHPGQRLVTIGARLLPSFVGDAVQVDGDSQHAEVLIEGDLQPAGTYTEVAGIRVGKNSTGTYASPGNWPFQPSVARSVIRGQVGTPFKGNGIIWENGPMLDLTQVYISDVTHDGIRAGGVSGMWDPNHGLLIGTHVVRAGRYGYHIKRRVTEANEYEDSRFNKFVEAKAYDCGVKDGTGATTSGGNFRIETNSNFGSIFSELGIVHLTANSVGNRLELEPFNAVSPTTEDPYGHLDEGNGNRLEGMSYWERYETITARFHRVEWNKRLDGRRYIEQTGANTFLDKIVDSSADTYLDYDPDTGHDRIDRFNGHLGLPGSNSDRAILTDTETGILTVPASTTVAAGATYTSAAVATGKSQYANGFATMFAGSTDLLVRVQIDSSFNAKVTVRNLSGAGIDISGKMIRWTVLSYRN